MPKRILFVLEVLVVLSFMLCFVANAVLSVGLDSDLYYKLQMRENVPQTAGISETDLLRLDKALANSLRWDSIYDLENAWNDDLQERVPLTVTIDGIQQPAFNERELLHMQDCCRLFKLLGNVRNAVFALVIVLILVVLAAQVLYDQDERKLHLNALWIASGVILLPLGLFALWAAIDFSSAFTFFHKILFTNDLWLLNPETDLLIRICPSSMFAGMGLRIALRAAAILLGLPLLGTLAYKLHKRSKSPDLPN